MSSFIGHFEEKLENTSEWFVLLSNVFIKQMKLKKLFGKLIWHTKRY